MSALYELTDELLELQSMLEDPDADEQVIKDTLEGVNGEYEIKLENYCKVIKNLDGDITAIDAEIERLSKMKKTRKNNIDRLKQYMFDSMKATGNNKIKGNLFTIAIQKNGGKIPVVMDTSDTAVIPDELVRIKEEPDLDKIREALESGVKLEFAHLGERGESLRIK